MLSKQDNFFEQGTSLLEVILSITLVLLLVPFMYGQIADMNDTVKNIIMANKIVKMHDGVKNYILLHSAEYENGENVSLDADVLTEIAPGAVNGFVRKVSGNVVSLEAFLEFNIDNSKYKAADMAKYIGDDAAVVQADNTAYSEYWAVSLSEPDSFSPGNLVYRISYTFSAGDEANYLHKMDYNNLGLNVMQRNLKMNNNELKNITSLTTRFLRATDGQIDFFATGCKKVDVETTNAVFEQRMNLNADATFHNLLGVVGQRFDICGFENADLGKLKAPEHAINASGTVTVNGKIEANELELFSDEGSLSANFDSFAVFNSGLHINRIQTDVLKPGETVLRITKGGWPVSPRHDFVGDSVKPPKINGNNPREILNVPSYTESVYWKIGVYKEGHN